MKTSLILLGLLVAGTTFGQKSKLKARVSAQYTKVMNEESFIDLSVKYKAENGFEPAAGLEFKLYKQVNDDSLVYIDRIKTDAEGKARFILNTDDVKINMSSSVFTYVAKIENNNKFEDNESSISFSEANLLAEVQTIDSVNQIKAKLTDASGKGLADQPLKVGLKRLYGSLQIGDESYQTDESGSILVPLEDAMPGIGGNLAFEIVLSESDAYGTVKTKVTAAIGTPIHDESTFDQRTMWSPPTKTPLYLLFFPSLIVLVVWGPLLILIFNLYRISKSKTN